MESIEMYESQLHRELSILLRLFWQNHILQISNIIVNLDCLKTNQSGFGFGEQLFNTLTNRVSICSGHVMWKNYSQVKHMIWGTGTAEFYGDLWTAAEEWRLHSPATTIWMQFIWAQCVDRFLWNNNIKFISCFPLTMCFIDTLIYSICSEYNFTNQIKHVTTS